MSEQTERIITYAGLTAPKSAWQALGCSFYSKSDPSEPDSLYQCRLPTAGGGAGRHYPIDHMLERAKDELPDDASAERILRRVHTLLARDASSTAIGELARGLNGYANALGKAINIPTNINVWHREAGMNKLAEAVSQATQLLLQKPENDG